MSYEYKLEDGFYCLFDGDEAITEPIREVSIAFDKNDSTLHKHGDPKLVQAWVNKSRGALMASGFHDMANDLISVTGRFPVDEINKCLAISDYVGRFYKKLITNEITEEPVEKLTENLGNSQDIKHKMPRM